MKIYYVNPSIFFLFEEGKLCLWNYASHEQFAIDTKVIETLLHIYNQKDVSQSPFLDDLLENDIIRRMPYPEGKWGWDRLSHIFHFGVQNPPELKEHRTQEEMIEDFLSFSEKYREQKDNNPSIKTTVKTKIPLPAPTISVESKNLHEALLKRMTIRNFSEKMVSLENLSMILFYTFGHIPQNWEGIPDSIQLLGIHKTSPSAGGIHATKAYVVIFSVEGLKPGVYLYDSEYHSLGLIHTKISWEKLISIVGDQFYVQGISFGVFMVADIEQVWSKYLHSRAYRETFLDAGHLSQTLQLLSTSISLNTWITGYFRDSELLKFLHVSEDHHVPLLFVGVGEGERSPVHPAMMEALSAL